MEYPKPMPKDLQKMRILRVEQVFTLVAVCEVDVSDRTGDGRDIGEEEYVINSHRRPVPAPYNEEP
jgi:hypothetical protein